MQVVPVLAPSLSENVAVEECGDDERECQMGAEENGVIGGRNVDQIALGHDRQILEGPRPQVWQGHESRDVEADEGDDGTGDSTADQPRIGQRMDDGDVAIQGHSDEQHERAQRRPHGHKVLDLANGGIAGVVGQVKVEGHVKGDDEADHQVGQGQRHHKVIGRRPQDRIANDGHDHQQIAEGGQQGDEQVARHDDPRRNVEMLAHQLTGRLSVGRRLALVPDATVVARHDFQ